MTVSAEKVFEEEESIVASDADGALVVDAEDFGWKSTMGS
jgi:hypothetical protein